MSIKVFGVNGNTRVMTAESAMDIYKISKCYPRWEFI